MVEPNSSRSEPESAEVAESYNQWLRAKKCARHCRCTTGDSSRSGGGARAGDNRCSQDAAESCRRLMHLFGDPWAVTLMSTSGSGAVRATLGPLPLVCSA